MKIFYRNSFMAWRCNYGNSCYTKYYKNISKSKNYTFRLFFVSTQRLLFNYPNIEKNNSWWYKKSGNRYKNLIVLAKSIGKVDLAISFRRSFSSKFMMFFIKAKINLTTKKRLTKNEIHLAIRYNDFVNKVLKLNNEVGDLKLYFKPFSYSKPTLGINPGATYGSAKDGIPKSLQKLQSV